MHSLLFNSFQNWFKIGVCTVFFSLDAIYELFRGNCSGQKYAVTCQFREEYHGGQLGEKCHGGAVPLREFNGK